MTASASGVIGFARAASTDMPLAAMFSISMLAWFAWYESASRRYLALSYIFLGLAVLAKGPVALFFALAIVVIFSVAKRDYSPIARSLWLPGIALFALTVLPWYIAVQWKNPEFFRVFILEHNLGRFGKDLYHHTQPFWYYMPGRTARTCARGRCLSVSALVETVRVWWREKRKGRIPTLEMRSPIFLVIWLIVPVLDSFRFPSSKLPGYIVPAMPAGTLLLAEYVRRGSQRQGWRSRPILVLIVSHALVASLAGGRRLMMQYLVFQHGLPWDRATAISVGACGNTGGRESLLTLYFDLWDFGCCVSSLWCPRCSRLRRCVAARRSRA